VYVGGLDLQVKEPLLWELFLQAGPVGTCVLQTLPALTGAVNVFMPKDRVTADHQGFGFVEFQSEEDADYAMKVMNMVRLFGKPIKVNKVRCPSKPTCHLIGTAGVTGQERPESGCQSVHW
jgi:splicing factor 3B subunit 4